MLLRECLLVLFISFHPILSIKSINYENICGHLNNRRIYLELGEHGYLTAEHVNSGVIKFSKNQSIHNECNLEIITCPSCIISIKFS